MHQKIQKATLDTIVFKMRGYIASFEKLEFLTYGKIRHFESMA